MKISELWLREWVNPALTAQEIAAQLTLAGLEVDAVMPVAGQFTGVIVGEILKTQPHPQADRLTVCEVKAKDDTTLTIVCGASNVRPGLKIALAVAGAQLPDGIQIKDTKLRGILSQGMICSSSELKITDESEGIMELSADAPLGEDLRRYLKLEDHIFDIDLTPNRGDCLSVSGIAREVAAQNNLPLTSYKQRAIPPSLDDKLKVTIEAPEACPIYCARILRNINSEAVTPLWISEKLRRCGLRLVHPVVDVMNFVMLELGQPMHAFDLNTIKGGISVRLTTEGEKIELLGNQPITLKKNVLVIADEEKLLAMAGIMGGQLSAVAEKTQDILLESAFFAPSSIAGVARQYGLATDASQRFERGVDPQLQIRALERATELLLSITGGKAGPVILAEDEAHKPLSAKVLFRSKKVKQLTGIEISSAEMIGFLQRLGMEVSPKSSEVLEIKIPSHRFDLNIEEDLVEEIIRLYGYDHLPNHTANISMRAGQAASSVALAGKLAQYFQARGYQETISYSFVDPDLQSTLYPEIRTMDLLNPISSELSQMRAGLWPGLLATMVYNANRQQHSMKLFEMGVAFQCEAGSIIEQSAIAGLLMGEKAELDWSEKTRSYDFYDLKGDLQSLASNLNWSEMTFLPEKHPALHSGQSAKIIIGGKVAGWIGVLHPHIAAALDISKEVILFELFLSELQSQILQYKPISKYPQIRRDLSFLVAEEISAADIKNAVYDTVKNDWLIAFDVFDVYKGHGVPSGKKSLAIALTLQDRHRTLIDTEINELIGAILKTLENKFAIILRE